MDFLAVPWLHISQKMKIQPKLNEVASWIALSMFLKICLMAIVQMVMKIFLLKNIHPWKFVSPKMHKIGSLSLYSSLSFSFCPYITFLDTPKIRLPYLTTSERKWSDCNTMCWAPSCGKFYISQVINPCNPSHSVYYAMLIMLCNAYHASSLLQQHKH